MTVKRLDSEAETLVVAEVERYLGLVEQEFKVDVPKIAVSFDLLGNTLGMYRKRNGERSIRFNSYAFAKYWQENFTATIPHEAAHYVSDILFDSRHIKPHGKQWQSIMRFFGAEPSTRCYFDLSDIPRRTMRRFQYICNCSEHHITAIRHNRIKSGTRRYFCRRCTGELVMAG
ncbi:MAG: SprT family zinc-dependent metalloprotease [Gammaproteobacteria bacterium]